MIARALLIVSLALVGSAAAAQAARADTGSIAVNSAVGDYATATFTVNKTVCGSPYYCGWFAMATQQPAGQSCSTTHVIWVGAFREGLGTASETEADFFSFASEGPHRLCLYVYSGGYTLLAEVVYAQDAPAPPPTPVPVDPVPTPAPPSAPAPVPHAPTSLVRDPMPGFMGRSDPTADRLAFFPGGAPSDVDTGRFVAIARAAADRWAIMRGGVSWRTFRFRRPDGRNAIGFARLPDGVLGTTSTWSARVYRTRRVCRQTFSGRRCRTVRRYLGRRVVERDTAIDPDVPWQQGPDYPASDEFDLETVILHELGHWAGNNHRRSCTHLMRPAIDAGDWWRDTDDYHFADCAATARAARAGARASGRLEHREHTVDIELPRHIQRHAQPAFLATAWARRVALDERNRR